MTHSPMKRAEDIFGEALDLPVKTRETYILAACAPDAALLAAVRTLLVAHEAMPEDFLGQPAAEGMGDAVLEATLHFGDQGPRAGTSAGIRGAGLLDGPGEKAGDCIGRYKLLQAIGEGGFGTVWMAEQCEPIVRKVALKVIKAGMDTREVLARFEAERQALAMMDHPNIAKVLDAGATDNGRPFFVMELVKGIPITRFCDEAALGTRERLALFRDVCSAINHAHQKGIIHRDIKPSNVMVTLYAEKAVVKVIDFGIAKATQGKLTDQTLFTRYEQMIGTPVYMSPEQAALSAVDIDTRSDIYSLGVLLYELLVGKPPFDGQSLLSAGYDEMRRIIREVEPVKPSTRLGTVMDGEERRLLARARRVEPEKLYRVVEPDLDWIVMKAIDKDRARRYESANSLAADIQHHLANEPVSARPPSTAYRLRKAWRRNRLVYTTGMVVASALVIGLVASFFALVSGSRRIKAEQAASEMQKAADLSNARAESTAAVVTGMLTIAVPKLLEQENRTGIRVVLSSVDHMVALHLQDSPMEEFTVRKTIRDQLSSVSFFQLQEANEQMRRMESLLPVLSEEELPPSNRQLFLIQAAGMHALYDNFEEGTRALQALRRQLEHEGEGAADLMIETLIMESDANIISGDLEEAERLIREAYNIKPDLVGRYNFTKESPASRLANVLLLQRKYKEAIQPARRAFDFLDVQGGSQAYWDVACRVVSARCGAEQFAAATEWINALEQTAESWSESDQLQLRFLRMLVSLAQGHLQEAENFLIENGQRSDASSFDWRLGALAASGKGDTETSIKFLQQGYRFLTTADTQSAFWLWDILALHPQTTELEGVAKAVRLRLEDAAYGWWSVIALLGDARRSIYEGNCQEALDTIDQYVRLDDLQGVAKLVHRQVVEGERYQYTRAVALAGLGRVDEAREAFLIGWNVAKLGLPIEGGNGARKVVAKYFAERNSRRWALGFLTDKGIELPAEALLE